MQFWRELPVQAELTYINIYPEVPFHWVRPFYWQQMAARRWDNPIGSP